MSLFGSLQDTIGNITDQIGQDEQFGSLTEPIEDAVGQLQQGGE